jgi:hypothetical protein
MEEARRFPGFSRSQTRSTLIIMFDDHRLVVMMMHRRRRGHEVMVMLVDDHRFGIRRVGRRNADRRKRGQCKDGLSHHKSPSAISSDTPMHGNTNGSGHSPERMFIIARRYWAS